MSSTESICPYGNFSETFGVTSSKNSQIWHTSRISGQTCCVQIAAAGVKSRGGNKGSKLTIFHTFLHVKKTVFEISEAEAVL